jgi:hypothetical protein
MKKHGVKKNKEATTCVKTFVYKGLGIPIKLINVPMKKAAGVWCLDIDMNSLMRFVLEFIVHKKSSLSGDELKYIRKQLGMIDYVPLCNFYKGMDIFSNVVQSYRFYILVIY